MEKAREARRLESLPVKFSTFWRLFFNVHRTKELRIVDSPNRHLGIAHWLRCEIQTEQSYYGNWALEKWQDKTGISYRAIPVEWVQQKPPEPHDSFLEFDLRLYWYFKLCLCFGFTLSSTEGINTKPGSLIGDKVHADVGCRVATIRNCISSIPREQGIIIVYNWINTRPWSKRSIEFVASINKGRTFEGVELDLVGAWFITQST